MNAPRPGRETRSGRGRKGTDASASIRQLVRGQQDVPWADVAVRDCAGHRDRGSSHSGVVAGTRRGPRSALKAGWSASVPDRDDPRDPFRQGLIARRPKRREVDRHATERPAEQRPTARSRRSDPASLEHLGHRALLRLSIAGADLASLLQVGLNRACAPTSAPERTLNRRLNSCDAVCTAFLINALRTDTGPPVRASTRRMPIARSPGCASSGSRPRPAPMQLQSKPPRGRLADAADQGELRRVERQRVVILGGAPTAVQ